MHFVIQRSSPSLLVILLLLLVSSKTKCRMLHVFHDFIIIPTILLSPYNTILIELSTDQPHSLATLTWTTAAGTRTTRSPLVTPSDSARWSAAAAFACRTVATCSAPHPRRSTAVAASAACPSRGKMPRSLCP